MDISKLRKKAREQQAGESRQKTEDSGRGPESTVQGLPAVAPKAVERTPAAGEAGQGPVVRGSGAGEAVPGAAGRGQVPGIQVPVPDTRDRRQGNDSSPERDDTHGEDVAGSAQEARPLLELAQEELKKYPVEGKEKELLCFPLGSQEYGIELSSVREIIRVKEITPVPNTADFILGIIVLRGEIIPIIDLRKRIGLPFLGFTPGTRFIMVSFAESMTGLVVDSIPDVKKVPVESIQPADLIGTVDIKFITGISTSRGGFTILLKLEEILKQADMLKA
ncbi:MAG: chemotaxis protein CheW [Deltaproteobacteria bacterium]|nr:chemotaxis protein CheW [Deltaproteobacteria bacterium]MCL5276739.1 chemotaxis protein CheW [Deltaproteobacteria bacterium]